MKKTCIQFLFLFALVLLGSSCSDRVGMANESKFRLDAEEVRNVTNEQFLLVTNPLSGEVLYWEKALAFDENISFDSDSEILDVTTGVEYGTGFSIKTFRDVKSGFKLSGFTFDCYEGQNDFDPLGLKNVELVISGTSEIVEIHNPLYRQNDLSGLDTTGIEIKNNIIYDYANDVTIVKGIFNSTFKSLQLAMRFSGEPDLKSLIIRKDDWVRLDDENHRVEVQQEDFSACTVHEIGLGKEGGWIMDAEAITTAGDRIALANWSNQVQTVNGDQIKVILDDRIELQDLWLSVRSSYTLDGNHFQKLFSSIPSSISIEDLESDIVEKTSSSYKLTTSATADLVSARYQYENNNRIFYWDIYQVGNSASSYTLPEIQAEYLDETILMKQVLGSPENFIVETFEMEDDLGTIYQQTNINRQLKCLDYNSSYESVEF